MEQLVETSLLQTVKFVAQSSIVLLHVPLSTSLRVASITPLMGSKAVLFSAQFINIEIGDGVGESIIKSISTQASVTTVEIVM